jgi:hypothetical protein
MSRKLLVLLGAGASFGYGPTTQWLTEQLLAPNSGVPGVQLFRRIARMISRERERKAKEALFLPLDRGSPNFEEIIQVVDEVLSLTTRDDSLIAPFVQIEQAVRPSARTLGRYSRYASEARHFILRQTKRCCDQSNDPSERPLVKALTTLADRAWLRVMSLNYDDLPAASGVDFLTGFMDKAEGGGFQTFQQPYPWPEDRNLWCQLHGSLLFRVKYVGGQAQIVRYRSSKNADRQRWINHTLLYQDDHQGVLSPMITGLRKSDAIQDDPFATYAHQLRAEAFSCDRWLIIGYGGGDFHINRILSQAKEYWFRSGRPLRIVVVGYLGYDQTLSFGDLIIGMADAEPMLRRSLWLFDEADPDFDMDAVCRPRQVSRCGTMLALSLDGVDWASSQGLSQVVSFLRL